MSTFHLSRINCQDSPEEVISIISIIRESLDTFIRRENGKRFRGIKTFDHAERIGLGTTKYTLKEIRTR